MEYLSFGFGLDPSTRLEISLLVQHRRTPEEELGRIEVSLGELAAQPVCELVLCSRDGDRVLVGGNSRGAVSVLRISLDSSSLPRSWYGPRATDANGKPYERHLFIMTRGTRGDVQPFVALACALANNFNWRVTICTELRYKSFVESHTATLERGAVQFCVSGGDTQRRVDSKVARWAIQRNSTSMQHVMMAYSEVEFFDSEAAIFHHVRRLKPDCLMFGFTLAHVAMIVRPADWSASSTVLTNYILLRGQTVPDLDADLSDFIKTARARNNKVIILAFSSMPVERAKILEVADLLVSQCSHEVAIVALMGDHAFHPEGFSHDCPQERRILELAAKGRILCLRGAPYDRLFAEVDAIVTHGGMGATSECLLAGVPVIVTGVLLFDQRFWGRRCHDLGIGPYPVHISDFPSVCVEIIDRAVADDSSWRGNAKDLAHRIKDSLRNDPSGSNLNAACVHAMVRYAPVFSHDGSRSMYKFYRDRRVPGSMRARIMGMDNFVVRALQQTVSTFFGVVHYSLYTATYVRSKIFRM
ncbi:Sterol 3-beta-glucosyltransferase [Hondaea fermentalgiana]|uniref:Sterol 3-beta-glucosyltransferase n=1 Tax=Hondaea fermentalgiana TaxID=2315210 RepID=A0A2R5GX59_9STRA|nr:Sterol 3-beta-glucosyltransferase [Hondaea fermentalgiana]|eukprot:GBG32534.1 Sterol 3-beta-glucosyltransferase [Hondaea fermentalgiana]